MPLLVLREGKRCGATNKQCRLQPNFLHDPKIIKTSFIHVTLLVGEPTRFTSHATPTRAKGFDVQEKQSGTSVKGKPRISKKGNKHLRKAMHMPALSAIRHEERFKMVFVRLVSKHGVKMKAAVAVQRKLLEMIYTIYKTNTVFDKDYMMKLAVINQQVAA